MKRQLLWLALAMSVLFNVFFAAGYLQARAQARVATDDDVATRVAGVLDLDDRQRAAFGEMHRSLNEEAAVLDRGIALTRQELIAELQREQPDLDRLRGIVDREAELHRQRREAGAPYLREFVRLLSRDQRRRLAGCFGEQGRDRHRRHERWLLERFDANGDGVLDEQERAAARSNWEERKREREREMMERFDVNSDGRLDEAEEATLREWMQNRWQ
ncbi:MAG: hypothetical protein ACYTGC_07990, partial [Planctomycetota bacterium]